MIFKVVQGDRPDRPSPGFSDTLWDLLAKTWDTEDGPGSQRRPSTSFVRDRLQEDRNEWGKLIVPLCPESWQKCGGYLARRTNPVVYSRTFYRDELQWNRDLGGDRWWVVFATVSVAPSFTRGTETLDYPQAVSAAPLLRLSYVDQDENTQLRPGPGRAAKDTKKLVYRFSRWLRLFGKKVR